MQFFIFQNFAATSLRSVKGANGERLISQLWSIIKEVIELSSKKVNQNKENNQLSSSNNQKRMLENVEKGIENKEKKVKLDEDSENSFKWKTSIRKAIKESSDEEGIKMKKLEKLLVSQFLKVNEGETEDNAKALFKEKVQNPKFVIDGKYIKLKKYLCILLSCQYF